MRVKVNQNLCIGAGLCVLSTSDVFGQRDEDGVVILLQDDPPETLHEKIRGAVRKCPSRALQIDPSDGDGNLFGHLG